MEVLAATGDTGGVAVAADLCRSVTAFRAALVLQQRAARLFESGNLTEAVLTKIFFKIRYDVTEAMVGLL